MKQIDIMTKEMDQLVRIKQTSIGALPENIDDDFINANLSKDLVTLHKQDRILADMLKQGHETRDI